MDMSEPHVRVPGSVWQAPHLLATFRRLSLSFSASSRGTSLQGRLAGACGGGLRATEQGLRDREGLWLLFWEMVCRVNRVPSAACRPADPHGSWDAPQLWPSLGECR